MDAKTFLDNFAATADAPGGVQRLQDLILDLAVSGQLVADEGEISGWPQLKLGVVARLRRGYDLPVNQRRTGSVPVYGANGPVGMHDSSPLPGPGVLTGRSGSIGLVHYVDGAYWPLNTSLYVEEFFGNDPRWVAILLRGIRLRRFSSFSAVPTLNRNVVHKELVVVPPRETQERIVAKVDELMRLCDDLKGCQERRDRATTRFRASALHALTEAETPGEFRHAWDRAHANWREITGGPEAAQAVRETILDLAVLGRLVDQTPSDGDVRTEVDQARRAKASIPGLRRQPPIPQTLPTAPLPTGWVSASIDELFLVTGGIQKSSKRRPTKHHFPYLRVANVQRGRLDLREIERFELVDGELDRLRLEPGDLLIVEGNGSESEIGRCARWNGEIEDCVHQNHLIRCRPMLPGAEHYLLMFLNSPTGIATMKRLAVTTSGLYNLSVGKIRAICFPLPPRAEQGRIQAKVDSLLHSVQAFENSLKESDSAQGAFAKSVVAALSARGGATG